MTKIYKLSLEQKSGLLTPLQSDTIFGQFCWQLKRTLGEDKLASFLELYENNQPVFTLSDGLYEYNGEVLFPKPRLLFKEDINLISKKDKIKSFLINKEIKSINYIHVLALNHFLNNRQQEFRNSFSNQKSTKIPESFTDLRISVQIDRATFTSVDSKLFSYNPAYLKKNKKEDKIEYAVLVKSLNEIAFSDFQVMDLLKSVFEIGFGKKKSSGYGNFSVIDFSEYNLFQEPENPNGFIIMGNYLPSKSDGIIDAYYDTFVKYGRMGEEFSHSPNPFKKPILFLTPGSCFFTNKTNQFYGRCTKKSEITDYNPNVIQCGIPFSLNFSIPIE